jgi:hypothetical protein
MDPRRQATSVALTTTIKVQGRLSALSITAPSQTHLAFKNSVDEAEQSEAPLTREVVMAGTGDAAKGPPKQKVTDIISTLRAVKVWPPIRHAISSKIASRDSNQMMRERT